MYTLDFTTKSAKSQIYDEDWTYSSNGIDWTINGAANNNATWAYVRTGGKTQKWSYYKSKSAIEGEISSLVLTAVNTYNKAAFTMKSVKLTVARDAAFNDVIDEVTLTDISTSMTFVPTEGKLWTNAYYMLYFTWSNTATSANNGMDVEKIDFYSAASTEPSITTSISELLFDNVETSTSKQLSFTLSGRNLTENAALSITGTNAGYFSVDPASISQEGGTIAEKEVTVTYTPTAKGDHNATLTIASGETTQKIALSGTGIDPLPIYTVSWMVDGESYTTGNPSTSVKEGKRVTALPTEPAAIGSKKFVGWTNAEIAADQSTAPTVLFTTPEDAPAVTANVTYHAVFATEAMGSSAWKRIKTLADITDGSYVIKNANYILPNAANTKDAPIVVAAPAIDDKTETITGEVGASMIWSFTTTGTANQFYVQNADENYLYEINDNDGIRVGSTSDKWTFAVNTTDYFSMKGAKNSRYCATYNDQDWRSYTSAKHKNYANGGKLELYKLTIEKSYSDYCTTFPDVQLSVGATGYATLYYSNYDLVVPANTEAYTFRSEKGALMESATYAAGTVIPAGEAVVVYTTNAVPCTLNFEKGIATLACDANSQLAGTDEETVIAPDADYYFYGLSLNSSNDINSVGFYWMEAGGVAFTNGAHKAYLKIPTSEFEGTQPVRGFAFKGTTTGVESVESSNNAPQAIYDLTGRRVSKAEKGIYIINGKKVIK